MKASQLK